MTATLLHGNAVDVLKTLPSESVQCVVTSPPYYGLRDYKTEPVVWGGDNQCEHEWGSERVVEQTPQRDHAPDGSFGNTRGAETSRRGMAYSATTGAFCQKCGAWHGHLGLEPTPEMYVAHLLEVFTEVKRVLRRDGTFWLNLGDSYASQGGREVVQTRNRNRSGGSDLVGGGSSRAVPHGLKPKDLIGIPWRVAFALQADGWWLRADNIWAKKNPMPESVKDRTTRSHEDVFMLTKSDRYYYDADAIREPHKPESYARQNRAISFTHKNVNGAPGQTPHSILRPRPNRNGLRTALEALDDGHGLHPKGKNKRDVWFISTRPYRKAHFATFPPDLVEPCVLAGSKQGDVVLDPFAGSGTVGAVCAVLGRDFIGIDLNEMYIKELAPERISAAVRK